LILRWCRLCNLLRFLGVLLLVICLVPAQPALALTAAYPQVYDIGAGLKYYNVAGENELGLQKQHYLEYTPNEDVLPVVAYGRGFYGKSTINYVADYLQTDLAADPLAGFNADFFNVGTGIPIGIVIKESTLITSAGGAYAVGFRADGTAVFGKPKLTMLLQGAGHTVQVENFNKTRSSYTVNLYDHNWGEQTRIDSLGTNVLLEKLEDTDPYLGCSIRLRVVSVTETAESTPLAANQMLLTIAATGDATKVAVFKVGDELTFSVGVDDSRWQEVVYAVGGKSLLLSGAAAVDDTPTGNSARTAIGFKPDGTMIFFENDGRQAGRSVGLSPYVLAQEMAALGATDAINLDGGGSSAISVKLAGRPLSVVNSPSDGSLRSCANYIFLLNKALSDGQITYLNIEPKTRYVLAGASVDLQLTALDSAMQPTALNSDPIWQVSNAMGTVQNNIFTAGDTAGTAVLKAELGQVSGSQYIYVLSSLSELQILQAGNSISQLLVLPGDKIDLSASGLYKGEAVSLGDENVTWELEGDIGTIDQQGLYQAGGKDESGKIIVRCGSAEAVVQVSQLTQGDGPNIVAVTLPTNINSGETANVSFRVVAGLGAYFPVKEQLQLLLDGQKLDFAYDAETGILQAELIGLADGLHRLTLVAADNDGVLARKSVSIRVGAAITSETTAYKDVAGNHWAADYITYLSSQGLMQGETNKLGEQLFNPSRNLTRAEFAVIVARYLKLDTSQEISLPYQDRSDIPGWSLGAIRAVYAAGIMTGQDVKGELYFYPRSNISRQEAMAVIGRILTDKYPSEEQEFTDAEQISAWAKEHVERLVTLGLVSGYEDDTIKPLANITRAEIAKILFNLY
jgi:hypothetical protein